MPPAPVVLHLIDSYGIGGAQQRYFNDLEHLGAPFEHWPCAVFAGPDGAVQGSRMTMPLRTLGVQRLRGLPFALAALTRLLRQTPAIKVVHTQLFSADIIGRIAGRLCGRPVVTTVQSSIYEPDSGLYSAWRHRVDRATAPLASRVIAVSDFVRHSVHRRLDVPLEKIVVIPNTVDTARVRPDASRRAAARGALELGDTAFAWLNVGRLHAAKGLIDLVDAFASVAQSRPDTVLLVAGGGPQLAELRSRAASLGVGDRIRFLGERSDILELLDAADGFVFPSLSEGLPVSLLEAMAMEKPCIASSIGPHEEMITDGESGLLVAPRDARSLAAAMLAIQDDAGLARELGRGARRRVQSDYEAQGSARALTDLYTSICEA